MEGNNAGMIFEGNFESLLSQAIAKATKRDEKLKNAGQRVREIKEGNGKIGALLDSEKACELTLEECKILVEFLIADNNLIWNEHRICYMRGLADGMAIKGIVE